MLAYNPKSETSCAGDQAILSLIVSLSMQARLFYQQAAALMTDTNIRRHFLELIVLHQQAEKIVTADQPGKKLATDLQLTAVCQWYQCHNTELATLNHNWITELPEQLRQQLVVFKRLSRELTRRENAKALANLTAGLQIIVDQLSPMLTNKKI